MHENLLVSFRYPVPLSRSLTGPQSFFHSSSIATIPSIDLGAQHQVDDSWAARGSPSCFVTGAERHLAVTLISPVALALLQQSPASCQHCAVVQQTVVLHSSPGGTLQLVVYLYCLVARGTKILTV